MHRVDARVVRSLERWRPRFEAGDTRLRGWGLPPLEAGERWSVRPGSVVVTRRNPHVPVTEWDRRPGGAGLLGPSHGVAYATDRRVIVADARRVIREWRFDELYALRATGDWRGAMMIPERDADLVDVLTTEWNRWIIGSAPNLRQVATAWLEVEATFAASRGQLEAWMAALPGRLTAARSG